MSQPWWRRSVFYEIYVRAFQDSDADGLGDLAGIIDRLDYLVDLGIGAIWLTPFYPSPLVDGGYDVANYTDVDPRLGSLEVFDRLLAEAHQRGLRVVIDLVPNHSSDRHPWFVDARTSRDAAHRDWYVWRDPAPDGGPPTNWLSIFGGSAWELDAASGQYYLHSFAREQPDLNWRNPALRTAIYDAMRFWLDRGVDGFRIDVLWYLIKDEYWRDNPLNPDYVPGVSRPDERLVVTYSADVPGIRDVASEMRSVVDEYEERVLIGELYLPIDRLVEFYGAGGDGGVHLPFNFHLITEPWQARRIQLAVDRYEGLLPPGAWPTWVIGNHDKPRVVSRVGDRQARVAALLLLTLRGAPTLYAGDELGMPNAELPPELITDPEALGGGLAFTRDSVRTPMRWDDSASGGFTQGHPWLPVGDASPSAESQARDPGSFLSLHRRLLALRAGEPALGSGRYVPIQTDGDLIAFRRISSDDELVVVANLGSSAVDLDVPGRPVLRELFRLSGPARGDAAGSLRLEADDGVIARVMNSS
jgi:alpha-glucosidase